MLQARRFADTVGIEGFAPGSFVKLEGAGHQAWGSWGRDGDLVLELQEMDDDEATVILRITAVYDEGTGMVEVRSTFPDEDVSLALSGFREKVAGMTLMVAR
jgi:hypothetical protein